MSILRFVATLKVEIDRGHSLAVLVLGDCPIGSLVGRVDIVYL